MIVYLVGGAVRDALLGRAVSERDYVVVGATEQEMLGLGYKKVGKDFPVFLHPKTNEEYALARRERKVSKGYTGFVCESGTDVSLEDDLLRRDLTINAMAQDDKGYIVDSYGGRRDLEAKKLRHVSAAFAEDPLRILRVARFAARYAYLGFTVASETRQLMYSMVKNREVESLMAERVWTELHKALQEKSPQVFIQVLRDCGALEVLFPELHNLFGVPATKRWHGEIDTGVHVLMVLEQAARLSDSTEVRFAALLHDLGKAATRFDKLPSHHGHDARGVILVEQLCARLKVPTVYRELAVMTSKYHTLVHKAREMTAAKLVSFFEQVDAFRRKLRFEKFLLACQADSLGRLGVEAFEYTQGEYLSQCLAVVSAVVVDEKMKQAGKGEAIKVALHQKRIKALKKHLSEDS